MLGRFLALLGLWPLGQRANVVPPPPAPSVGAAPLLRSTLVAPTVGTYGLVGPTVLTTQLVPLN